MSGTDFECGAHDQEQLCSRHGQEEPHVAAAVDDTRAEILALHAYVTKSSYSQGWYTRP